MSLAVNFFRLIFVEIVVASTEFGGKEIGIDLKCNLDESSDLFKR
jgi:hypothetical protein